MLKLSNGNRFPRIGFGTFRIQGEQLIYHVVNEALKAGYRGFDTAAVYGNEKDISKALKELLPKYKLSRKDIYITTKLSPNDHGKDKAKQAIYRSLENLQVSYIDLFLIHWPGVGGLDSKSKDNSRLRKESWFVMVDFYKKGILKNIGVSNYNVEHLSELLKDCNGVQPVINQVEFHPKYSQKELLEFCNKNNILVQAYCSLGGSSSSVLLNDPTVQEVAKNHNKTPAQILLVWALQKGVAVIPKSISSERIFENIQLNFELNKEEMNKLDTIEKAEKFCWDPRVVN